MVRYPCLFGRQECLGPGHVDNENQFCHTLSIYNSAGEGGSSSGGEASLLDQ